MMVQGGVELSRIALTVKEIHKGKGAGLSQAAIAYLPWSLVDVLFSWGTLHSLSIAILLRYLGVVCWSCQVSMAVQ